MNPWEQLVAVQAVDTHLDQLRHRLAGLPERAAVTQAEAAIAAHEAVVAEVEAERHVLVKEQKRLEDEIALIEDKKAKSNETLYGSASNDTKQLQALQDEIAMHAKRISALEDEEIEILEQLEPLEAQLAEHQVSADALAENLQAALVALAEAEAAIEAEIADADAERATAAAGISEEMLATYDKVRSRNAGVAVAWLDAGVCGACHIKLSAVEYDRVKHVPDGEPIECEECGRFLVRR